MSDTIKVAETRYKKTDLPIEKIVLKCNDNVRFEIADYCDEMFIAVWDNDSGPDPWFTLKTKEDLKLLIATLKKIGEQLFD
jgi:hypothetical protein